ncbi:HAMP domain-containing sensor histidine kinase [Sulfurimonas sp. C5]|uniref:sensor histidine kinase n=1 Tax=Sulfurimonas sp. C5 TaxID=3036947 RepID=UPI0024539974|nr:HAMP domain-containing sensor histidine kinase [Sulfurimonas sp. C5]MDH4944282.1 HAMP domain-containing sensor histidine kinase [Sulfurimonas sp. C5]
MNNITKKSFYSFLALYLISSFIFLSLTAYWFYSSQVAMEKNNNFYKMNHIADVVSSEVIHAAMMHEKFHLKHFDRASVALIDKNKKLIIGNLVQKVDFTKDFYMDKDMFTLVSTRSAGHLGVAYIVIQSDECIKNMEKIKNKVAYVVVITAILIIIIAVFLSYIFLKPIKDKMNEIEAFVRDTTHELNTPITALMMSLSRLKAKQTYDPNILNNISISTKQLHDIYAILSYVSFDTQEAEEEINFAQIVQEQINYVNELSNKKNITIKADLQPCYLTITPTKAKMLISNLLGNAIKYSHQNGTIEIITKENFFSIQDYGIGIPKEKLHTVFQRFVRASEYSGGFGVGLNIVEEIAKEYDYIIQLESQEGIGTKITLNF